MELIGNLKPEIQRRILLEMNPRDIIEFCETLPEKHSEWEETNEFCLDDNFWQEKFNIDYRGFPQPVALHVKQLYQELTYGTRKAIPIIYEGTRIGYIYVFPQNNKLNVAQRAVDLIRLNEYNIEPSIYPEEIIGDILVIKLMSGDRVLDYLNDIPMNAYSEGDPYLEEPIQYNKLTHIVIDPFNKNMRLQPYYPEIIGILNPDIIQDNFGHFIPVL